MKRWKFALTLTVFVTAMGFYVYIFKSADVLALHDDSLWETNNDTAWNVNAAIPAPSNTTTAASVAQPADEPAAEDVETPPPSSDELMDISIIRALVESELAIMSPEPQPRAIVVVTTWRSGSTFLGELLNSFPATFYHYEPLMRFRFEDLSEDTRLGRLATEDLRNLLHCNYNQLEEYLNHAELEPDMFDRNVRLSRICTDRNRYCHKTRFLTQACSVHPYQLVKEVRMRLAQVATLLDDSELAPKLRLILLVRDPRGTINSRQNNVDWCNLPVCEDPEVLCNDLSHDYDTALQLHESHPGSVYVLRYEDLARKPMEHAKKLFQFLGLPMNTDVIDYIERHTEKDISTAWTTYRKSAARVAAWRTKMAFEEVLKVQMVCESTMAKLGYKVFMDPKTLLLKGNTVLPFQFPPT